MVINFVELVFHVATQVGDIVIVGVLSRYIVLLLGLAFASNFDEEHVVMTEIVIVVTHVVRSVVVA